MTAVDPDERFYLFGADRLGRDMLSRTLHGTRVSMSIGLVGVAFALILGISLGGISGYFGGRTDTVIQRIVEFTLSLPTIPDLAGARRGPAAGLALPLPLFRDHRDLSLVGWTELARVVRGRFLALQAPRISSSPPGSTAPAEARIIFRHMLPSPDQPHHRLASRSPSR